MEPVVLILKRPEEAGEGRQERKGEHCDDCGRKQGHAALESRHPVGPALAAPPARHHPRQEPEDERHEERVERVAQALRNGVERPQLGGRRDARGLHCGGIWIFERPADQKLHQPERDVVEHDRVDDFMGACARLEVARDRGPQRAAQRAGQQGERQVDDRGQAGERLADQRGADRADVELAFDPDVEQAALEADGQAQSQEDVRGHRDQRLGEAALFDERAPDHPAIRGEDRLELAARDPDDERADQKGAQDRQRGHGQDVEHAPQRVA